MSLISHKVDISQRSRSVVSIESFQIQKGTITFLFGESGIGKSLLAKAVFGVLNADHLRVTINDRPYDEYRRGKVVQKIQKTGFFVFQEPSSHLNPLMRISEQLSEGSLAGKDYLRSLSALWSDGHADLQALVDIYPQPYRPSGGEKQRILLAMALMKLEAMPNDNEAVFMFDEPTGSLDDHHRNIFIDKLMETFRKKPFTGLFTTHDYSIISRIFGEFSGIADRIEFRELYRRNDALFLRTFVPSDYTSWIATLSPPTSMSSKKDIVLEMHSDYRVFGKTFSFFQDQTYSFPRGLTIRTGDLTYLKAPSGGGKTTLARIIMGLTSCEKMTLNLRGIHLSHKSPRETWARRIWGKKACMVFQHADEALNQKSTVWETFQGLHTAEKLTSYTLLHRLKDIFFEGITPEFLDMRIDRLSGGQKQRINLMRALVLNTDLIILDEPFNGLDFRSIQAVLSILDSKRREGTAFLMISHNEEIVDQIVEHEHTYYLSESSGDSV